MSDLTRRARAARPDSIPAGPPVVWDRQLREVVRVRGVRPEPELRDRPAPVRVLEFRALEFRALELRDVGRDRLVERERVVLEDRRERVRDEVAR